MGSLPESKSEISLAQEDSFFPPCGKAKVGIQRVGTVPVIVPKSSLNGATFDHVQWVRSVRVAWALLLRAYLSKDAISFAAVKTSHGDAVIVESSAGHVLDVTEASLYQYQSTKAHQGGDNGPCLVRSLKQDDVGPGRVNTALCLDCQRSEWPKEAENLGLSYRYNGCSHEFDLVLRVNTICSNQGLSLLYHSGKYSQEYASLIAATLQQIIHEMSFGKVHLSNIDCMSARDKKSILAWNPELPKISSNCVHSMVSSKAKEVPGSEAVCSWDGSLTYSELDEISSTLADRLILCGVKVGDYIPFVFEKSMWAIVATLAILKAGGAFVPLDPSHPKARLEEILKSTGAKIVVTSKSLVHLFDSIDMCVVPVSAEVIDPYPEHAFTLPSVQPSDPIFVLFTSGSTGRPKGMVHTHGAICTYFLTHGQLMGYHGARVLQFSAYTFDAAILDIFTTLIFGGCVCVPSEEDRITNITGVINQMQVDFALLTPSFASLMAPGDVPSLKNLCVAGECLTQEVIGSWAGKVRLMNAYGPAEVGICFLMDVDGKTRAETIGFPLLNCSCWLVDPEDQDRLVPVGAVGELVVASPSLAREYLNDETKTKTSFISGLAWADSVGLKNCTFFKTGDLLRYNNDALDGSCDFVRRKDAQIKLHGQRIEAGDVECRLVELPDIAVAIVVQPKQGCFAGELVAVLQMSTSKAPRFSNNPVSLDLDSFLDQKVVKKNLEKQLPGYMVPMSYLICASVLVNPSGKIDRKAILAWVSSFETRPFLASEGFHNQSNLFPLGTDEVTAHSLSRKVADLVALKDEVRGLMLLGHDFNLLEAGVDSIQIIQLLMFLRTFGVRFPAGRLWSSHTRIRDLAYMIDHGSLDSDGTNLGDTDCLQEYRFYEQELMNDLKIVEPARGNAPVSAIFVTGASGFVGLRILQNLLTSSACDVYTLVRCQTPSEGLSRLVAAAKLQGWWSPSYDSRLHVWPGDLSKPHFALSKLHLDTLCGVNPNNPHINAIIHNAARVHYNLAFDALQAVNTIPTLALLKIHAQSPHISSFVYVSGGMNPAVGKVSLEEQAQRANHTNGYAQTKFVSESIVKRCAEHAAFEAKKLHVIKPGYIVSGVDGDEPDQSDFLWRLTAACLEVKAYDQSQAEHWLFISDVGHVAGKVGDLALRHDAGNANLQILDGIRLSQLWRMLREEFGYELCALPGEEWRLRLESSINEAGEKHVLFPVAHKLSEGVLNIGVEKGPEGNLECGRVGEAVRWNVKRLVEDGFLPPPPA